MPLISPVPKSGSELKAWRLNRKFSQARVADALGVSRSRISRWERDNAPLPLNVQARFPEPPGLEPPEALAPRSQRPAAAGSVTGLTDALAEAFARASQPLVRSLQDQASRSAREALAPLYDALAGLDPTLPIRESIDDFVTQYGLRLGEIWAKIAESLPADEEVARVAVYLNKRGWFLSLDFETGIVQQLHQLVVEADGDAVDTVMRDYARARAKWIVQQVEERSPERGTLLRAAERAHEQGEFGLSVPVLLAQADGLTRDITRDDLFRKTRTKKEDQTSLGWDELEKSGGARTLREAAGGLEVLLDFVRTGSSVALDTRDRLEKLRLDPDYGPLNRHGVLHGKDTDYATEDNSLRAFLLVGCVLSIEDVLLRAGWRVGDEGLEPPASSV